MTQEPDADRYSNAETKARAEETLKRMLTTPPKSYDASKKGRESLWKTGDGGKAVIGTR
jgi:hypothetical protein